MTKTHSESGTGALIRQIAWMQFGTLFFLTAVLFMQVLQLNGSDLVAGDKNALVVMIVTGMTFYIYGVMQSHIHDKCQRLKSKIDI